MTKNIGFRLVTMLALALASGQVHADSKADAVAELARARDLDSHGDHKKACKAYQHASELAEGKSAASLIGLSNCYSQVKDAEQAIATARQALAAAETPEERSEATQVLGDALLREPGERGAAEALAMFKEQVAGSGGAQAQRRVLTALLVLHRDQEAAEILADLRKQGKSEDELQHEVLFGIGYPGSGDDRQQADDFNERLYRLDPETPLRVGGKVSRPEIRHQVKPEPNAEARHHRGFSGTVILETIIDKTGKVTNVRVLRGQPMGLNESAMDAVKQWTFKPATLDGKPVRVFYVLTVNFEIG
jgi:TonB family protein